MLVRANRQSGLDIASCACDECGRGYGALGGPRRFWCSVAGVELGWRSGYLSRGCGVGLVCWADVGLEQASEGIDKI